MPSSYLYAIPPRFFFEKGHPKNVSFVEKKRLYPCKEKTRIIYNRTTQSKKKRMYERNTADIQFRDLARKEKDLPHRRISFPSLLAI